VCGYNGKNRRSLGWKGPRFDANLWSEMKWSLCLRRPGKDRKSKFKSESTNRTTEERIWSLRLRRLSKVRNSEFKSESIGQTMENKRNGAERESLENVEKGSVDEARGSFV
jgi:hypothetical protein